MNVKLYTIALFTALNISFEEIEVICFFLPIHFFAYQEESESLLLLLIFATIFQLKERIRSGAVLCFLPKKYVLLAAFLIITTLSRSLKHTKKGD